MNEPLQKEEWKKRVEEFKGSYRNVEKAKQILEKLRQERIQKYSNITNCENCTGDFIAESRNCKDCYDITKSQDCRYIWVGENINDSQHGSNLYLKQELVYETLGTISPYNTAFSLYVFHSQNILYCDQIYNSKNLFACVSLKKKEYCIFNKQYARDEYEKLVPKILEYMKSTSEYGEFFPPSLSPHGYNETLANDYYPLSKEQVLLKSWNWHKEEEGASYQGPKTELADNIEDINDDIVKRVLLCEITKKPYKLMKQELALYRSTGLPIPRRNPDQRHKERMLKRNPRHLNNRACMKCQSSVQSTFTESQPATIYCEQCYQETVF